MAIRFRVLVCAIALITYFAQEHRAQNAARVFTS
jgi:hypothetical protein